MCCDFYRTSDAIYKKFCRLVKSRLFQYEDYVIQCKVLYYN